MANIREQGINTLWATCQRIGCGHEAKVDASRFSDFYAGGIPRFP
jgi:hypothetical protein